MKETKKPSLVTEAKQIMPYVERALNRLGFSDLEVRLSGFDIEKGQDEGILIGKIFMGVYPNIDFEREYKRLSSPEYLSRLMGFVLREEWNEGLDEILLREGPFDRILGVAGHELGHILTPDIYYDEYKEEQKAYAFQVAWLQALCALNVSKSFVIDFPAKNVSERHYMACKFIKDSIESGCDMLQLYWDIAHNKIKLGQA